MRDLALALLIVLAGSHFVPLAAQTESETVRWHANYAEAVAEARRLQKPIFLEFRCAP